MTAEPTQPDLHAAIMNLPCKLPLSLTADAALAFKLGHRDARHAAAELASAAAVPVAREGWQMVPKEPTPAMDEAGYATVPSRQRYLGYEIFRVYYRAMLASAPPPPEGAPVAQPVAEPLTDEQIREGRGARPLSPYCFEQGVRFAERAHNIGSAGAPVAQALRELPPLPAIKPDPHQPMRCIACGEEGPLRAAGPTAWGAVYESGACRMCGGQVFVGTFATGAPAGLYTAEQMHEYARAALSHQPVGSVTPADADALGAPFGPGSTPSGQSPSVSVLRTPIPRAEDGTT